MVALEAAAAAAAAAAPCTLEGRAALPPPCMSSYLCVLCFAIGMMAINLQTAVKQGNWPNPACLQNPLCLTGQRNVSENGRKTLDSSLTL